MLVAISRPLVEPWNTDPIQQRHLASQTDSTESCSVQLAEVGLQILLALLDLPFIGFVAAEVDRATCRPECYTDSAVDVSVRCFTI